MGISVTEMQVKLRKGDANLLSIMLATPLGMALYQESQKDEQGDL